MGQCQLQSGWCQIQMGKQAEKHTHRFGREGDVDQYQQATLKGACLGSEIAVQKQHQVVSGGGKKSIPEDIESQL